MADRVAVVGADGELLEGVRRDLAGMGILTEVVEPSRDVADRLVALMPSGALLIHAPPRSLAFDALRAVRSDKALAELPTVVVGRDESAELDTIVAFELGTDDFVRHGVGHREIALRVRAVLRRASRRPSIAQAIRVGPIDLDISRHLATVESRVLPLTAIEFRLLAELARNRGRVVSRQELLERVWAVEAATPTRTLDTHVKRLREKLGDARRLLETIRGVGYRLRVGT